MKYLYLCLLLLFCANWCLGQKITLRGIVLDAETQEPLPFCTIRILDTPAGTVSEIDGTFSLPVDQLPVELEFSFVGYRTQRILVKKEDKLTVKLEVEAIIIGPPFIVERRLLPTQKVPFSVTALQTRPLHSDDELIITPVLNRIPGVYMQSATLNTNRLTIRGIGSRSPFATNRVRIYYGDIPITNGVGESAIEDLDMSMIQHATIWKGPGPSRFGASLGGVIQLNDRLSTGTKDNHLETGLMVGSFGQNRQVVRVGVMDPPHKNGIHLRYFRTHSDGYRENNEVDRQGVTFLAKRGLGTRSETTLTGFWSQTKAFIPSSLSESDFLANPSKAAANWQAVKGFEASDQFWLGISHRQDLKEMSRGRWRYAANVFMRLHNGEERRPFNVLDEHRQITGLRSSLDFVGQRASLFSLFSVGAELFQERYDWQTYETLTQGQGRLLGDNRERRAYYQLFAEFNAPLWDNFECYVGLNLNQTTYQYEDYFVQDSVDLSGNYQYQAILSPNIGLSYRRKLFLSYLRFSHGSSVPSLEETLTPAGLINPDIRPEQGWNLEWGAKGGFKTNWTYELALYNIWVNDLLVADRVTPDQFVGVNAGKTRHAGLEASLRYQHFIRRWHLQVESYVNYHLVAYRFVEFVDDGEDYSGNPLTGVPPHQLSGGGFLGTQWGFFSQVDYLWVAGFSIRDDHTLETEGYQLWNVQMGYRKTWDHWLLKGSLGVQNLLDARYASMVQINAPAFGGADPRYYYPGLPRNCFFKASIGYHF